MRLGVDARVLVHQRGGVARYLGEVLACYPALRRTGDELELYVDRSPTETLPGEPDRVTRLVWPGPGGDPVWRQLRLALRLARRSPELLFCPFYTVPLASRTPSVVTIHDVAFVAHPEWFGVRGRLAFGLCGLSARRARHVLTVSEFSAGEIHRRLDVPAHRIQAIPHGLSPVWRQPVTPEERVALREWLGHAGPYVLHLGAVHRRRNVDLLLRAFASLAPRHPDLALVVAGPSLAPGPPLGRLERELALGRRLLRREWVPEPLLRPLMAEARVFAYLSAYEGFGIPALEAMAVGAPVAALRRTSLPEVLGDAAAWIDDATPGATARVIESLLRDDAAAAELARAGRARAAGFRWEVTAARTFEVLRAAAGG